MQQARQESNPRDRWPGFVEAGLLAALVLALAEQVLLGPAPMGIAWVVVSLFVAVGVAIGLVLEALEYVVRRSGLTGLGAAAVRASSSIVLTVPVARTLFEGAFASQLPGASVAHFWLPAATYAALTVFLTFLMRRMDGRRGARMVGGALLVGAAASQVINRNVKPSELPDLHIAFVIACLVAAILALRAFGWPTIPPRHLGLRRGVIVVLTGLNVWACLRWGLVDPDDRWAVATRGTDARLLVRATRALLDRDQDGYAAVLGGGDCDDYDSSRNPGVPEIPDNDADENCDGVRATSDPKVAARVNAIRADLDAWSRTEAPRRFVAETRGYDILLISVDALRADVMVDSEENRRDFPHLFDLAHESVQFERAFAPAAGTDLSMSTILTGHINPFSGIDRTLPEAISATGVRTHAVIPSEVLRYAGKTLLTRGLDDYDRLVNDKFERDVGNYSTSRRTTELALSALDRAQDQDRLFSWVHYFDVHEHGEIKLGDRALREQLGDTPLVTAQDRYRATVKLVDSAVGELIAGVRARGRYSRTIVVLVSDHGESLGEDPRLPANHGLYVYNPLVHVPFLVRVPGLLPRVVAVPISLLDVAPTLAQLAGAELGPVDGTSLLPVLLPGAPEGLARASRPIVLNESEQYGVIVWPHKLMQRPTENLVELYDLELDFGEQDDLAERQPERVRKLLATYHAYPRVELDRTRKGRRARELAARSHGTPDDG